MKHDPHHNQGRDLHRPLVTVERQYETDIATGKTQGRMFVKMYFDARDSGLLAAMPGELWKMLCCLATYMDENGNCSPSQERIARDLGLSRQRVNERIQALRAFRFQGKPVLLIFRPRKETVSGGRWGQNQYHLSPIAGVGIFDGPKAAEDSTAKEAPNKPYVRNSGHRPMSGKTGLVVPDINKNHVQNQNTRVTTKASQEGEAQARELVAEFHIRCGHPATRLATGKEITQAGELIAAHGFEAARAIVGYAVREAESTRFDMVYFGATLAYKDAALADLHERAARERSEGDRQARAAYERFRTEAIARHRTSLSPAELARLEEDARSRAPEANRKLGLLGGWVRVATDDAIAHRFQIPEFEAWVAGAEPDAPREGATDPQLAA